MLGAIIGDIVGSTREWHNVKTEDFELLPPGSRFTDDTVMTLAVAKWLMDDPSHDADSLVRIMQEMGRRYPNAGYGGMFQKWLNADNPQPYGSYGNGSAMRVSPVGMYAKSLDEALELAYITASVTHNHPEGIKGAQAVAAAVYMQLYEVFDVKEKIKRYVEEHFGYNLDIKLEDIRDEYHFDFSCQGSVPIAIMAYLQRHNALDTLRLAISMGGDSDTIGCMATSIAYACRFGMISSHTNIPTEVVAKCRELLPKELLDINDRFEAFVTRPLYQSYYLKTRNIFAGEYPGDKNGEKAQVKIDQMAHFGVRHFIDLTEEGELRPYSHLLPKGCTYTRFQIHDVSVPDSVESVSRLIDHIHELSKRDDGYVYIHCWGGVGRTGTIVGCLLSHQYDFDYEITMNVLKNAFSDCPKSAYRNIPETQEQCDFIARYAAEMKQEELGRQALLMWKMGAGDSAKRFNGENPIPQKTKIATKDSWNIEPMPDKQTTIPMDENIPSAAMRIVKYGHIPDAMEDHWFMYCDETTIRYYRSWTGFCIYVAKYEDDGETCRITELTVNRDSEQYTCTDDKHDVALFMALLTEEYGGDASEYWQKAF